MSLVKRFELVCKKCGKIFIAKAWNRKYCPSCLTKTCAMCGKIFLAESELRKYCSSKCYHNALMGRQISMETRKKISEANKGHIVSEETRGKLSVANKGHIPWSKGKKIPCTDKRRESMSIVMVGNTNAKGYKHTDVARKKISEANKGRKHTEETKRKLSEAMKGNTYAKGFICSEETRKRRSEAAKGRVYPKGRICTEETRRKLSRASKGRKHTKETKEKIRQANLGKKRPELSGDNNPMHTHLNAYKSCFGKTGHRKDLGIFVRSTWEANMIRIFNCMGLHVQYEPQSFRLSNGKTYRPDFYIHETEELIEVKGRWIGDARERVDLFQKEYPDLPFEVIGPDKYYQYIREFADMNLNLEI